VDINTIRTWLGHVSIDPTHIYAEVDLERKAQGLAQHTCKEHQGHQKRWKDDPVLLISFAPSNTYLC
jgi:integrase/recombinase XerD